RGSRGACGTACRYTARGTRRRRRARVSRGSPGSGPRPRWRGVSSASGGTPSSEFPSVAVCDLRGHERIAERAFELPADLDDADLHPGLDADRVAEAEVRARAVRTDERNLDHDESPSSTYGTVRLKGLRSRGIRRAIPSPIG